MPTPRKGKGRSGRARARKGGNLLEAGGRFRKKAKPKELRERAAAATSYRRNREDLGGAPEHIERILRLISDNAFRQGFNVERLRHALGLRSHDATTEFRRQTGATIGRYIEDRRLECAERLLLDTDLGPLSPPATSLPPPARTISSGGNLAASAGTDHSFRR